jgi:hypothetical protein
MVIKTTININTKILLKLNYASTILQISVTHIIKILLQKYSEQSHQVVMFSPKKYQKHDKLSNWHTFHINFQEYEYEIGFDFTKIYKKSLSLIIAESIKKYLDLLINKFKNLKKSNMDSYLLKNYLFFKRIKDGVTCGIYFWGLPSMETLQQYIT